MRVEQGRRGGTGEWAGFQRVWERGRNPVSRDDRVHACVVCVMRFREEEAGPEKSKERDGPRQQGLGPYGVFRDFADR
jgi:hypothetical protein